MNSNPSFLPPCKPTSPPPSNIFTDRFKAVLLLLILVVIYVSCLSLLCCRTCSLQLCEGPTSWLSCVLCCLVFFSLIHMICWVRCGVELNRFLTVAYFFIFNIINMLISTSTIIKYIKTLVFMRKKLFDLCFFPIYKGGHSAKYAYCDLLVRLVFHNFKQNNIHINLYSFSQLSQII